MDQKRKDGKWGPTQAHKCVGVGQHILILWTAAEHQSVELSDSEPLSYDTVQKHRQQTNNNM